MVKAQEEVISEFNEYVNMTAEELEAWLKSDDSNSAGWPKDDAEGGGETVGHDSGRKIVEILQANPEKKEDEYTDEQVEHMRKVVAYCKRHLAQESKGNNDKSPEEVKKTKSYASLKNWGHDFLKAQGKTAGAEKKHNGHSSKKDIGNEEDAEANESQEKNGSSKDEVNEEEEIDEVGDGEEEEEEEEEVEEKTGDKRKNADKENGSNKKRQTRQSEGSTTKKTGENAGGASDQEENGNEDMEEDDEDGGDKENGGGKEIKNGPKEGDTVSWNWGNGHPEGKVLEVKGEKTTIETKRGNEVTRDGNPDDPAVVLDTGKSKVIKSNHELNES